MPEEKRLCLCGCGKEINAFDKKGRERLYVLGHQNINKKFSEEWKSNLGLSRKKLYKEGKQIKMGFQKGHISYNTMLGKHHTEETKLKMSLANKGRKFSDEQKRNMSIARKGKNYSSMFKKGCPAPKTAFKKGQKPWNYIDGRSKLKSPNRYGDDWEAIRLIIYMRDNYKCQECGITMNEYKRPLDIHHKIPFLISHDNSLNNLITLCRSCHMKIEKQVIKQQKVMLYA